MNTLSLFYLLRSILLDLLQHFGLELFNILRNSLFNTEISSAFVDDLDSLFSILSPSLYSFYLFFIAPYVKQSRVFISGYVTELGYGYK